MCIYVCVCLSVSETEKQREGVQGRNGGRSQQAQREGGKWSGLNHESNREKERKRALMAAASVEYLWFTLLKTHWLRNNLSPDGQNVGKTASRCAATG